MFRLIATITMILFLGSYANAQEKRDRQFYINQIDAVYSADFFDGRPEVKDMYVEMLRDRVVIMEKPGLDPDQYPLLSTVGLLKTVTPQQAAYLKFDPETFNPLMYNIDFFNWDESIGYHVDGTDYYIVVQPQTRQK